MESDQLEPSDGTALPPTRPAAQVVVTQKYREMQNRHNGTHTCAHTQLSARMHMQTTGSWVSFWGPGAYPQGTGPGQAEGPVGRRASTATGELLQTQPERWRLRTLHLALLGGRRRARPSPGEGARLLAFVTRDGPEERESFLSEDRADPVP